MKMEAQKCSSLFVTFSLHGGPDDRKACKFTTCPDLRLISCCILFAIKTLRGIVGSPVGCLTLTKPVYKMKPLNFLFSHSSFLSELLCVSEYCLLLLPHPSHSYQGAVSPVPINKNSKLSSAIPNFEVVVYWFLLPPNDWHINRWRVCLMQTLQTRCDWN